jgi:transcriptional regulator CtsR
LAPPPLHKISWSQCLDPTHEKKKLAKKIAKEVAKKVSKKVAKKIVKQLSRKQLTTSLQNAVRRELIPS